MKSITLFSMFALLAVAVAANATPANDAAGKAVGEHYVGVKVAGQDKDIALAKCQKDTSASKRKVCRAEADADYKKTVAKADAAKKKALADAELLNVKEQVKADSTPPAPTGMKVTEMPQKAK